MSQSTKSAVHVVTWRNYDYNDYALIVFSVKYTLISDSNARRIK